MKELKDYQHIKPNKFRYPYINSSCWDKDAQRNFFKRCGFKCHKCKDGLNFYVDDGEKVINIINTITNILDKHSAGIYKTKTVITLINCIKDCVVRKQKFHWSFPDYVFEHDTVEKLFKHYGIDFKSSEPNTVAYNSVILYFEKNKPGVYVAGIPEDSVIDIYYITFDRQNYFNNIAQNGCIEY